MEKRLNIFGLSLSFFSSLAFSIDPVSKWRAEHIGGKISFAAFVKPQIPHKTKPNSKIVGLGILIISQNSENLSIY